MPHFKVRLERLENHLTPREPFRIVITLSSTEHPTPPPPPGAIVITFPEVYASGSGEGSE